jgi:hypothetical protein
MKTPSRWRTRLAVWAIVTVVLAVSALVSVSRVREVRTCRGNMRVILGAMRDYYEAHDGQPAPTIESLTPVYLSRIPLCPLGGVYAIHHIRNSALNLPTCSCGNPRHKIYWKCGNSDWMDDVDEFFADLVQ